MGGVVPKCPTILHKSARPMATYTTAEIEAAIRRFSKLSDSDATFGGGVNKKTFSKILSHLHPDEVGPLWTQCVSWRYTPEGRLRRQFKKGGDASPATSPKTAQPSTKSPKNTKSPTTRAAESFKKFGKMTRPERRASRKLRSGEEKKIKSTASEKANMIEILCGLAILSNGMFDDKLKCIYNLFDFNEDDQLQKDEFAMLLRSCLVILSKFTMEDLLPTRDSIQKFTKEQFEIADASDVKDSTVSFKELRRFVLRSPIATGYMIQYGTSDTHKVNMKAKIQQDRKYDHTASRRGSRLPSVVSKNIRSPKGAGGLGGGKLRGSRRSLPKINNMAMGKRSSIKRGGGVVQNIKQHTENMEKSVSALSSSGIPQAKLMELRNFFIGLDKNGDGSISCEELEKAMQENSLSNHHVDAHSADGKEQVTFIEFLQICFPDKSTHTLKQVALAFESRKPEHQDVRRACAIFDMVDAKRGFKGLVKVKEFLKEINECKALSRFLQIKAVKQYIARKAKKFKNNKIDLYQAMSLIFCKTISQPILERLVKKVKQSISSFGEEEMSHLKEGYMAIDVNGDGILSREEFKAFLTKRGVFPEDCDKMYDIADVSRDGELHFQEFCLLYATKMKHIYKTEYGYGTNDGLSDTRTLSDEFVPPRHQSV
mmetsp:Transcript_38228/g.61336  ORF Transcript_38228/g.61336 Transcript_38228/m.61336 type:complete len:655 (-) Transcript_38228:103-2067(-)